ncbi:MAG: tRNA (adenosine(37)-N6)-dimethylallyltransferase MiaA [Tahibacter sp.]
MSSADQRPLALFLMGPTASGKTALACALAQRFPVELISVDSALVYRGLDIGSAKPDLDTLRKFPHRLIDIRDAADAYSAGDFRADALREMREITAADAIPLLVGGTGLYFRALQYGLSALPAADPELRAQLQQQLASEGLSAMHRQLAQHDPLTAARIRATDTQRVLRALEVIALTGSTLSELHEHQGERLPYRILKLALLPIDRAPLHARIAQRFDDMLAADFLDEVVRLRARGDLHADLPSMRAVGYRQAWQHLDGAFDRNELRERGIHATRQLAKRQITMLRGELDALAYDPEHHGLTDAVARAIGAFVQSA